MTEVELYENADNIVGIFLQGQRFNRLQPGEYTRTNTFGEDRVLVSKGPPSKAMSHFAVFLTYYPNEMRAIDELFSHLGEDRGFLCGPYLSPIGVTRRPKYWSYKTAEILQQSLVHVVQCIQDKGLPWLESLRNPKTFAENADLNAVLPAAFANELGTNLDKAKVLYQEMLRRYLTVLRDLHNEKECLRQYGRPFVFVATKLGVEQAKCKEIQSKLQFFPAIEPLPR